MVSTLMKRARVGRAAIAAAALAAALGACESPSGGIYGPAAGGAGYAETQIERDRFSVRFRGDSRTPRDRVESYALLRAAEITLAAGGGHFRVVSRDVEAETRFVTAASVGGFSEFGYFRRSPSSFGTTAVTARPITRYEAFLEIVIAPGPRPDDDPDAYDAAEVVSTLGPTVSPRA